MDSSRRRFLEHSLLAAAAAAAAVRPLPAAFTRALAPRKCGPNEIIRIGVLGVRGRGRGHIGAFKASPDAEVVAICDPDEGVIEPALKSVPDAVYHRDLRRLLDDDSIDAVSIATPNHWHALAAIWALQAGKHVYVEKPVSHNVFEGRQLVRAAQRYGKVVATGTQARSATATRDAIAWLHGGGLGEVRLAKALCYKRRESIGKVEGPQPPPATLDYDLWCGPAPLAPLTRQNLHYDWHWDFATGNGDLGNQGVHQMDIARWGLGLNRLPKQVASCGGRLGYLDDGETPNTQVALLDWGGPRIVFEVRGLPTPAFRGASIGVIFFGEKGALVSASYDKLQAFDPDGQVLATFEGDADHFQNFLDAIKAGDPGVLAAPILDGHLSSALCHLANASYRAGEERPLAELAEPFAEPDAGESFVRLREHLLANGIDPKLARLRVGPTLAVDAAAERFLGPAAGVANLLLTRDYRAPFVVPAEI